MGADFRATAGGDGTVQADTVIVGGNTISGTELGYIDGVTAGTVTASKAVVVDSNKRIDTLVIADGGLKLGSGTGTAVTSTAAELNLIDGSVAGTAVASKALVLGADKNVDTLSIADGGLKLGAGAGTAVTSTAAEINKLAGVTEGTVTASKAVVVDANKKVDVWDPTSLKINGTAVTSTAAEINTLASVTAGTVTASKAVVVDANKAVDTLTVTTLKTDAGAATRFNKVARIALTASDTAGGLFSWQNDEGVDIIVNRIVLDVTTKSTAACTVDCGTTAVSGTTLSDNLLNGLDVGTAAGVFNNFNATDAGTNGKTIQKLASGKWVTGSTASGASAGIVGFAYIYYTII